ncbi:MAG TPA: transporter substrate-binding domain-containing protein [Catenuloplanes sp.]
MTQDDQPGSAPAGAAGPDPAGPGRAPSDPAPPAPAAGPTVPPPPTTSLPVRPFVVSRGAAMAVRLVALGVTFVVAAGVAVAVVLVSGPPSVADLRREAGLNSKQELLIGVKDDQPGVALRGPDGVFTGFDIDIAHLIAEELDFRRGEVRFLAIESEDRARMQATDGDGRRATVDLVIASYSITPQREAVPGVTFSAPYLFTEQSVITLKPYATVSTLEDLRGKRVCTLATATSETAAKRAGAVMIPRNRISQCVDDLFSRSVEAVSTDAAILAGFVAHHPRRAELKHHDIGDDIPEAWGINVGENQALRELVNLALYKSRNDPADSRWEAAFDKHLRAEEPANLPAPIAVAGQPEVNKVNVRQWPWERVPLDRPADGPPDR